MIILNHVNHSHILCIVVRVFEFDNCSVKKGTLVNTEMKLYLLLLLLPIAKSNIVLDFEGDNDSIAKLKVDLQIPINESTFCINFYYQRYGNILMFRRGPPFGLYLAIDLLRDLVYWQFDRQPRYSFDLQGLISPYQWIRFCIVNDDKTSVLVSEGQVVGNVSRKNDLYPDQSFIPIPDFYFGIQKVIQQKDIKVTDLNVWSVKLPIQDLKDYTKYPCKTQEFSKDSMIIDWTKINIEDFDFEGVSVKISNIQLEDLCKFSLVKYFDQYMTF